MKEISKDVKSSGKVIGVCKAAQADTWADAVKIAGGEKEALAKFNAQHLTDCMNKMRKPGGINIEKAVAKMGLPKEAQDQIKAIFEKFGKSAK